MLILSHRGYWLQESEKNTKTAFERSFALGFGTETDVRDRAGQLVISHDMPDHDALPLSQYLELPGAVSLPQAINVKADGLCAALGAAMRHYQVQDWFVFDMSVPDTRAYLRAGLPVLLRMSEVEPEPAWLDQAVGVWLDAFESEWYDAALIGGLLDTGKRVCVVSAELHGRATEAQWALLRPLAEHPRLMLCTDRPEAARTYFETNA